MKDDFDKWPCDAGHHNDCIGQIVDPNGTTWGRCPCECHKEESEEDWTERDRLLSKDYNSDQKALYDDYHASRPDYLTSRSVGH